MAGNAKRSEFLRKKKIEVDVMRAGIRQKVEFILKHEEIPTGKVPYLFTDKIVNMDELFRIASEFDLPIISPIGKVFPPGKKANDFVK